MDLWDSKLNVPTTTPRPLNSIGFELELKSGGLIFHCEVCDSNWPPTAEETAFWRREFVNTSS